MVRWSKAAVEKHKKKTAKKKKDYKRVRKPKPSFGNAGRGADLGDVYFRSTWERNFARYLNWQIKCKLIYSWQFEPDRFMFHRIKRGNNSYLPDFKVWETKNSIPFYYEVKGYMDRASKTKLNRMALYYPEVKIVLIDEKAYKRIKEEWARVIPNWEY